VVIRIRTQATVIRVPLDLWQYHTGTTKYHAPVGRSMALTCNYEGCTEATKCVGASERDDANVVVEKYECADGHEFHETIPVA